MKSIYFLHLDKGINEIRYDEHFIIREVLLRQNQSGISHLNELFGNSWSKTIMLHLSASIYF
jgi:hypothetical protein